MNRLDGIDPELRAPLEELRETFPGGLYAIADLAERRRTDAVLAAELNKAVEATRTCSTEDVRVPGADVPVDSPVQGPSPGSRHRGEQP